MKKRLVIVGGGHAGSSAALSASKVRKDWHADEIEIHLIDKNSYQTIKPRLYEYELEEVIVPYVDFLPQAGVLFHQDEIVDIDLENKKIVGKKAEYNFDTVILAVGSELQQSWDTYNIDNYQEAVKLRTAWQDCIRNKPSEELTIAILGGGFTGIELATQLPVNMQKFAETENLKLPKIEIFLMDRGEVGASLGQNPKDFIQKALKNAGIHPISRADLTSVEKNTVFYTDGKGQEHQKKFDIIINTLGQKPNPLVQLLNLEKDNQNRIKVNGHLSVLHQDFLFVAGDMASAFVDEKHTALMTCQQGRPQGRHAGYNAIAYLTGRDLITYTQPNYVTCLDLGADGALYTEGWDRKIRFKGAEAKKYKQHINQERIYPPTTGNTEDLYQAGKLKFKSVLETVHQSKFANEQN